MDIKNIMSSKTNGNQIFEKENFSQSHPLKGKELLKFIEKQKKHLEDNGDSICIGAGYGAYTEDGATKCKLEMFSTELLKAKKELHQLSIKRKARQQILETYDIDSLKQIPELGCISSKAHLHLQISENERFFDENEEEIRITLEDQFGINYLLKSAERAGGEKSHWKHRAVWRFIEVIANEELESKYNNDS